MVHALLLLVGTGISWVLVGAIVGWIGRLGFNLMIYQIISGFFGLLFCLYLAITKENAILPPDGISHLTWCMVVVGCYVNGLFNYFMIRFMGRAMKSGPNAIVWAIIQSGLIYPFLMGWLVFDVPMNICRAIGIVLIVASIILYAAREGRGNLSPEKSTEKKQLCGGWILPSILGMLCCGINQCGGNLPSYMERGQEFPSIFRQLMVTCGILSGCVGHLLLDGIRGHWPKMPKAKEWGSLVGFSLLSMLVGYTVSVNLQFPGLDRIQEMGRGSMAYPVMVAACIIGFFPYGLFVLREKLRPIQAIGAVIGTLGIIIGCL